MQSLEYTHVNVFSPAPFSGNSLPVFIDAGALSTYQMQRITQELRHFECIFIETTPEPNTVRAHVFDLFEELPFAGHPIIGAAAALHHAFCQQTVQAWRVELPGKSVAITTERTHEGFFGLLDQGTPEFLGTTDQRREVAQAFNLELGDLHPDMPLEIVSTGLRYLIVPVLPGVLERAHIAHDLTEMLRRVGSQFAVLLDESGLEVRHWNNDGVIEDIATCSAAGTVGAYRLRHGLTRAGETFVLNQGRFVGRPSQLKVRPEGTPAEVSTVKVGGHVSLVGRGQLDVLPELPA